MVLGLHVAPRAHHVGAAVVCQVNDPLDCLVRGGRTGGILDVTDENVGINARRSDGLSALALGIFFTL